VEALLKMFREELHLMEEKIFVKEEGKVVSYVPAVSGTMELGESVCFNSCEERRATFFFSCSLLSTLTGSRDQTDLASASLYPVHWRPCISLKRSYLQFQKHFISRLSYLR
jgi:hypothetical protein